jgi:very-short-patch-repair endonuclease
VDRLAARLQQRGGVARTAELRRDGFSDDELRSAVRRGTIRRARIGWYATHSVSEDGIKALRIGGVLACVSAAREYGFEVPPAIGLHVLLPDNASRLRPADNGFRRALADDLLATTLHWTAPGRLVSAARTSVSETLREVVQCQPPDWAVACLDSAIRTMPHAVDLERLRAAVPEVHRRVLDCVDARAESCIESLARVRLRRIGLHPQLQVPLAQGIRVDMLLDGRLVIELDGSAFHSGAAAFEADRSRDAYLNALGYRVLHFSYRQVVYDWRTVEDTVRLVLRQAPSR